VLLISASPFSSFARVPASTRIRAIRRPDKPDCDVEGESEHNNLPEYETESTHLGNSFSGASAVKNGVSRALAAVILLAGLYSSRACTRSSAAGERYLEQNQFNIVPQNRKVHELLEC
jgi:hypothetical protein